MPRRAITVAPGDWIKVNVTGDPFPVTMAIGDTPAQAAFIEHTRGASSVVTTVQRRCPRLSPGIYPVVVKTPVEVIRTNIRVT